MAFSDLAALQDSVELLQRSLSRGRLGHAYLFHGPDLAGLETVARTLAKTLNCQKPKRREPVFADSSPLANSPSPTLSTEPSDSHLVASRIRFDAANRVEAPPEIPSRTYGESAKTGEVGGLAVDCCDACVNCRKIDAGNHPDVFWVRPESKLRLIRIEQIRQLLPTIYLKPTQAPFKVATLVAADRLNVEAANAFLKTLEEPPTDSILLLLSTEPHRVLETILSRCLRLGFGGERLPDRDPALLAWLSSFSEMAAAGQRSLLGRYQLLSGLLTRLNELKQTVAETLARRSPLETHDDIDSKLKEKWEDELSAAIEAEYRRRRADLLLALQWWLRDVWLETLRLSRESFTYPTLAEAAVRVARRLTPQQGMENLQLLEQTQRLLSLNVQEALALEVGLLRLKL